MEELVNHSQQLMLVSLMMDGMINLHHSKSTKKLLPPLKKKNQSKLNPLSFQDVLSSMNTVTTKEDGLTLVDQTQTLLLQVSPTISLQLKSE